MKLFLSAWFFLNVVLLTGNTFMAIAAYQQHQYNYFLVSVFAGLLCAYAAVGTVICIRRYGS